MVKGLVCWGGAVVAHEELWVGTTNPAHVCMSHPSVYHISLIMAASENEFHLTDFLIQ